MKIVDHKLVLADGRPARFRPTPNFSTGVELIPKYLVIHYTAGASFESSVSWLTNPQAQASAHLVIGREGEIAQLADFNARTWHAGRSSWLGLSGLNSHSIGIELDNAGPLQKSPAGWMSAFQRLYPDSDVIEAAHKNGGAQQGWHRYSPAQLDAVIEIAAALVEAYSLKDVIGHDDIAPARKRDPGPAFPMDMVRSRALGRQEDTEKRVRTLTVLNIRTGPSTSFDRLPESPLAQNVELRVTGEDGHWLAVDVLDGDDGIATGWVHAHYVAEV